MYRGLVTFTWERYKRGTDQIRSCAQRVAPSQPNEHATCYSGIMCSDRHWRRMSGSAGGQTKTWASVFLRAVRGTAVWWCFCFKVTKRALSTFLNLHTLQPLSRPLDNILTHTTIARTWHMFHIPWFVALRFLRSVPITDQHVIISTHALVTLNKPPLDWRKVVKHLLMKETQKGYWQEKTNKHDKTYNSVFYMLKKRSHFWKRS